MDPRIRFLMALRNLYNKGVVKTIDEAIDFAKREFGEINDLFKRQIEQVFKRPQGKTPKPGEGGITSIKNAPKKKDETAQASGSIMDQIEASKNKIEGASNRITEIQKEIDAMYKPKPETSPLMERLEKGIDTLKTMKQPGMDLTVGITRTAVRKILDRSGIQVPDKVDPIDFFVQEFGADALMDVKNVAEEMIEIERMGKATKSMDEILEQTGMFNIKRDPNAPKGISNEELEQIKKEVDQEKELKDFDPTDRTENSEGGLNTLMASNDMNERLLEKLYEDFLEQGFSPEEAARKAREAFSERSNAAMGGRAGFFKGAVAGGGNISPGTDVKGNVRNDNPFTGGGGDGGNNNPPPKPEVNKIVEKLKLANTSNLSPFQKFMMHNNFVDQLKARRGKNYHELGGFDFMARFPNTNPNIAKGLASAYQNVFEIGRAVADGPGGKTIGNALDTAEEEARLNSAGIDAFADPSSSLYQQYFNMVPESGAVQMADGGRTGFADGPEDPKKKKGIMKVIKKIPRVGKAVKVVEGVTGIIKFIKTLEPIEAMKEVNKVIAKDGPYKNVSDKDTDKIFKDTQDHIFERDPKPSEFDVDFDEEVNLPENVDPRDTILPTRSFKVPGSKPIKQGDEITSENFGESQFAPDTSGLEKARELAPKMVERLELKQKYPGLDEDILTAIMDDPDPNNKAQVLATLDTLMELQRQGKSPEEAIDIIKQTMFKGRRDNSKGGLQYLMGL